MKAIKYNFEQDTSGTTKNLERRRQKKSQDTSELSDFEQQQIIQMVLMERIKYMCQEYLEQCWKSAVNENEKQAIIETACDMQIVEFGITALRSMVSQEMHNKDLSRRV